MLDIVEDVFILLLQATGSQAHTSRGSLHDTHSEGKNGKMHVLRSGH